MTRQLTRFICVLVLLEGVVSTHKHPTLNKCCPLGQSFAYDDARHNLACRPSVNDTDVSLDWIPRHNLSNPEDLANVSIHYGFTSCSSNSLDKLFLHRNIGDVNAAYEFELLVDNDGRFVMTSLKTPARHDYDVPHPTRFPSTAFCVDAGPDDMHVAHLCPCDVVTCVRKCCEDRMAVNESAIPPCGGVKDKTIRYWLPDFEEDVVKQPVYYRLVDKSPECRADKMAYLTLAKVEGQQVSKQLILLSNGSLQTKDKQRTFPPGDYCADYTVDYGEVIYFCSRRDASLDVWSRVYGTLFLIGAVALLLTVSVTLAFAELRQNLHQQMALAHNSMLLISNATAGVGQWMTGIPLTAGKAMSFVIQFSLLSAFLWLNAMCIDITWVFSGHQQSRTTARRTQRKFAAFAAYSWGTGLVVTLVMAVFEFSPSITVLKPNFATKYGFFNNRGALWLFLYGPIAAILIVNCVLFIYTTIKIMAVQNETSILSEADSRTNSSNKQNYLIFTKLFCLMGLSWVTEIMGLLIGGSVWAWFITDTLNLLEGVIIFIIFCCTRAVYNLVHGKLRRFAARCGMIVDEDSQSTMTKSSTIEMNTVQTSREADVAAPHSRQ